MINYPSDILFTATDVNNAEYLWVKSPLSKSFIKTSLKLIETNSISYTPDTPGNYQFKLDNSQPIHVVVNKKHNIQIVSSDILEKLIPITIELKTTNENINWSISFENEVINQGSAKSFSFTPLKLGTYNFKVIITDDAGQNTYYRQFAISEKSHKFMINVPSNLESTLLPYPVSVLLPFKKEYNVEWSINGKIKKGRIQHLSIEDFTHKNISSLNIKIYKESKLIDSFHKTVYLVTDNYINTGYIDHQIYPSGNYAVSVIEEGILNLKDLNIHKDRIIMSSDEFIILKPPYNTTYHFTLNNNGTIIDNESLTEELADFDFDITYEFLTEKGVIPASIQTYIENSNIPNEFIKSYSISINDTPMFSRNGKASGYTDKLGENEIKASIILHDDKMITKTVLVELVSKEAPTCQLNYDSIELEVFAACSDSDSIINTFEYKINHTVITKKSYMKVTPNLLEEKIEFTAVDTQGLELTILFTINEGKLVVI